MFCISQEKERPKLQTFLNQTNWNWNLIETEIDLIAVKLGQSIAEILSN